METKTKYKIVKGDSDPYENVLHVEPIDPYFVGQLVGFNDKSYRVVTMPYKNYGEDFYTIELENIQGSK